MSDEPIFDVINVIADLRRLALHDLVVGAIVAGEPWALRRAAVLVTAAGVASIQQRNRIALRGIPRMIERAAMGALGHARFDLADHLHSLGEAR